MTEDGTIVLNEPMVIHLGLSNHQIELQAERVRAEIERRSATFRRKLAPVAVEGKTCIIIDDGLASGYTMMAAITSVRQRRASGVVAAVPVASGNAYDLVKPAADDVVSLAIVRMPYFAVASFYVRWHDLTDEEVLDAFEEWERRQERKGK